MPGQQADMSGQQADNPGQQADMSIHSKLKQLMNQSILPGRRQTPGTRP